MGPTQRCCSVCRPTLGQAQPCTTPSVTSVDKYLRDQSGDQLDLLNDTGFSADATSPTSIPKSQSVVRVIFVPSSQFQEAWWTQPCVDHVTVGSVTTGKIIPVGTTKPDNYNVASNREADQAAQACAAAAEVLKTQHPDRVLLSSESNGPSVFVKARKVRYDKWSPNALAIFRDLSVSAVAGTHVVEESELQPSLTQIVCPSDNAGDLSLPSSTDKTATTISCQITGKNLYKFVSLVLRDHTDLTDTTTATGNVTVKGGSDAGTVTFKVADLRALKGTAYDVYELISDAIEQPTTQVIHLPARPPLRVPPLNPASRKSLEPKSSPRAASRTSR